MPTDIYPSLQHLASGIYEQNLTVARSAAYDHLVDTMEQLVTCHNSDQPLYLLQDASGLDLAYTPRIRAFVEIIVTRLHRYGKTVRVALVLPSSAGSCTDFMNCLLRQRETTQVRHMCFTTHDEAVAWLQSIQHCESRPAALGL
jgi:hypothetical protein